METYIAYQGGGGITKVKTEIPATNATIAKRVASGLFECPGRWQRTKFTDMDGKSRLGWTKGGSGMSYGDNYIHMYLKEDTNE